MSWLGETEKSLDDLAVEASGVGNDPEKIKARLAKHREFQRALSGKQATYDATMKAGKALKDRAPKSDEPALKQMMTELKNKWTAVCAKSVDRYDDSHWFKENITLIIMNLYRTSRCPRLRSH